ncbi:DNA (cytosine-5-)-methyltransferase [Candidatus Pelagibacter ubique]|uniref:DNA cytosine methyltransferase n=1 Tax=Pelagibacter ubique TaxID=198252 RepID=UPI00041ABE55
MTKFKLAEFFSGPGGMGYGASISKIKDSSIEHAWATDYDQDSCNTYKRNIKSRDVYCEKIENFFNLVDKKKIILPRFDCFAYGFPCNDFSNVGEQLGFKGKFGPLYSYGVELINRYHPKWFVAENVGGIKSSNEGKSFTKILKDLEEAGKGYDLTVHKYKFEEYGIPQARHRIIIVGIKKELKLKFKVPKPTFKTITSKEALSNIPKNAFNNELTNNSKQVIERLKYIKPGMSAFNSIIPKHLQLNVKGAKISQIYKRLDPNKPSYTVTGSGGGGTHVYHWKENRALTNRERARLQTFPDSFVFEGSKESVRKQIGMAVPVLGAKIVFEAILKTFAGVKYPSID